MDITPGLSSLFLSYFLQVITDSFQIYRLEYQNFIQQTPSHSSKEKFTLEYWHQNASLLTSVQTGNIKLLLLAAFALLLCLVIYTRTAVKFKLLLPVVLSSVSCLLTLRGDILRFQVYSVGIPFQRALVLFSLLQTFVGETWYIFVFSVYSERKTISSSLMKLFCINGVGIVCGICYLGVLPTYFFPNHAGLLLPMITVVINVLNIIHFTFAYLEFHTDKCILDEKEWSQYLKSGEQLIFSLPGQESQDEALLPWSEKDSFRQQQHFERDYRKKAFLTLYFILEVYSTVVIGIKHKGNFLHTVASVLNMNIAGNFSVLLCSLLFSILADIKDFRKPSVKAFLAIVFVSESVILLLTYQCSSSGSSDVLGVCLRFASLVSRDFLFINFITGCMPTGRVLGIGWLVICKLLVTAWTIGFQNDTVVLLKDQLL